MDSIIIKSKASSLREKYWGTLLLSQVLLAAVLLVPLIGFIIGPTVCLGTLENFYNAYKGEPVGWRRLYGKFDKQFESSFLYGVLFAIVEIVFVAIAVVVMILLMKIIKVIGLIIGLIIVILVAIVIGGVSYIGWIVLLKNEDVKGDEAFREAFKKVRGHSMEYIVLASHYLGGLLLTVITFGLYGIKFCPECVMAFVILSDTIIDDNDKNVGNTKDLSTGLSEKTENNAVSRKNSTVTTDTGLFCQKCGKKNDADAIFCEKCGNRLM